MDAIKRASSPRMSLLLPEERPFLRSSTSPLIVVGGIAGLEVAHTLSSTLPSPASLSPEKRSHSANPSRKNSFIAFLSPSSGSNSNPTSSTAVEKEEEEDTSASRLLSPTFHLPKPKVKLLKKTASVKQLYNSVLDALRTISRTKGDLMPELTKTFFEKILRDSERQDLQVTKVKVKDGAEFGRHFCSEVHAVDVTAKLRGGDSTEVFQLIIKSQPVNEDTRKFLQPNRTFEKEVQMYASVFVAMANFVKSQGIIHNNFHESEIVDIPKCYYTRWSLENNVKDDMIIMENLIPKGFVFIDQGWVGEGGEQQEAHVDLTVKEVAKLHAISFCMKEGNCENLFERFPTLREDSLYRSDTYEFTNRTFTPILASLAELIRCTPRYADNYEWFVELAKNFHSVQTQMVQPCDQFGVICHGDLWWSNILFRYTEPQEERPASPTSVKFIDFQSARISSLATDLLSFAFTSLSSSSRRTRLPALLQLYHSTFVAAAKSLNFAGELFTLEELEEEFEDKILFGFLEGIWYLDIIYQSQRPIVIEEESKREEEDLGLTKEELEEAEEIREKEEKLKNVALTEDQEHYQRDFFAMLEDVIGIFDNNGTNDTVKTRFLQLS